MTLAVVMVRRFATVAASFARILLWMKLGMAIAAMIKMIATTISNSISENPRSDKLFFLFFSAVMLLGFNLMIDSLISAFLYRCRSLFAAIDQWRNVLFLPLIDPKTI
jgi:hypothetical protein